MQMIDEKGKLFGKINVIDFLVILLLLCMLPGLYLGYKILNPPGVVEKKAAENIFNSIDLHVFFKCLKPEMAKLISPGDKEIDDDGRMIGEILEIDKIESNFIKIDLGEGRTITKEDAQRRQVVVKIRVTGRLKDDDILYKENKIKIGSTINFKTDRYEARGIIISESSEAPEAFKPGIADMNPINLDLLFINLSPDVSKLVSSGDFELDKDGDTIAKVLNVGKHESYRYKVDLGGGNYVTRTDSQKRQLLVKMEIMGRVEGNAFYFRNKRIALDSVIEFNTNKYDIKGVVNKEPTPVKSSLKLPINLDLLFINLSPDVSKLVSSGDFELDKDGDTIAKVLNVGKHESYSYKVDLGDGNYVTRTDSQKRQLLVKMEIMGRVEGNAFYFRDKRIALDSVIEFNTNKYDIKGVVNKEAVLVKKIDKKWTVLKVKFTNLMPELVKCINEGDAERDIFGDLVAKVTSIISDELTETMILIQQDEKLGIVKSSNNKDVVLSIEVLCIKTQRGLFFKESQVKVGGTISLQTDEYDIKGMIIGIEEVRDL